MGSRGSVIPMFLEQRKRGKVTVTDSRMTRFWLTLGQGVRFVVGCLELACIGGEIFVPENSQHAADRHGASRSLRAAKWECIGIRLREKKLHEVLVSEDEARQHAGSG